MIFIHRKDVKTGLTAHLENEMVRVDTAPKTVGNVKNILCIHPISAHVQVVHTNRAEDVFDGDSFGAYTVYWGNGLCDFFGGTLMLSCKNA